MCGRSNRISNDTGDLVSNETVCCVDGVVNYQPTYQFSVTNLPRWLIYLIDLVVDNLL